jgi:DNA-directed RNA polymerase alpha subunit
MKNQVSDDRWDKNLPESLPEPALRALTGIGIERVEQLAEKTEAELLELHGVGPQAIELLRKALAEQGLSYKQE